MKVTLFEKEAENENERDIYLLRVMDDDDSMISEIPIDVSGGLVFKKWKLSTRKRDKDKRVIGVYFLVSIMGHDLDQWRYYDLDLGKDVT